MPFLLPDTPVVAWWPASARRCRRRIRWGRLAIRRITDATNCADPLAAIKSRLPGYTAGDTDLAWSRITYWRALLASAIDQPPHEPIESAVVSGLKAEPALDILAGWLASRIDGPVHRAVGDAEGRTASAPARPSRSAARKTGVTATLSRTASPEALIPLARRETPDAWPRTCAGSTPTRSTAKH